MKTLSRLLVVSVLAFSLSACMSSLTTSIAGHSITARTVSAASLKSNGQAATLTIDNKTPLMITHYQITWAPDGAINLPANWNNIGFKESADTIEVTIDGKPFTKIRPPKK